MKSSAKKVELASVDDLFSTEESRADAQREKVVESQHDMDSTDIDRVMQTLPFAQEEPFTEARPRKPLFWFYARKFEKC